MKRGGRAVRQRELRAAVVRVLSAEVFLCWDCRTVEFRVDQDGGGMELKHLPECPVHRSAWSKRAADDYLRAVLILGGIPLADYDVDDLIRHSRAAR